MKNYRKKRVGRAVAKHLMAFVFCFLCVLGNGRAAAAATGGELELYKGKPEVNQKFEAVNIFPGDALSRDFSIKVYHDEDVNLYFRTVITDEAKKLGDALMLRVIYKNSGEVLYELPFAEANGKEISQKLKADSDEETTADYRIEVFLDTSAGNEYQDSFLKADFEWYVESRTSDGSGNSGSSGGSGALIPPKTGDTPRAVVWTGIGLVSLLLILLPVTRRRKAGEHEQK